MDYQTQQPPPWEEIERELDAGGADESVKSAYKQLYLAQISGGAIQDQESGQTRYSIRQLPEWGQIEQRLDAEGADEETKNAYKKLYWEQASNSVEFQSLDDVKKEAHRSRFFGEPVRPFEPEKERRSGFVGNIAGELKAGVGDLLSGIGSYAERALSRQENGPGPAGLESAAVQDWLSRKDKNIPQEILDAPIRGLLETTKATGRIADLAAVPVVKAIAAARGRSPLEEAKSWQDAGQRLVEGSEPDVGDSGFLEGVAYDLARSTPFTAASLAPALLVRGGGAVTVPLSLLHARISRRIESAMEADGAADRARKAGWSDEDIARLAETVYEDNDKLFWVDAAQNVYLVNPQIAGAIGKTTRKLIKELSPIKKFFLRVLGAAAPEAGEEWYQEGIVERGMSGEPILKPSKEKAYSALLGAIMGGGAEVAGQFKDRFSGSKKEEAVPDNNPPATRSFDDAMHDALRAAMAIRGYGGGDGKAAPLSEEEVEHIKTKVGEALDRLAEAKKNMDAETMLPPATESEAAERAIERAESPYPDEHERARSLYEKVVREEAAASGAEGGASQRQTERAQKPAAKNPENILDADPRTLSDVPRNGSDRSELDMWIQGHVVRSLMNLDSESYKKAHAELLRRGRLNEAAELETGFIDTLDLVVRRKKVPKQVYNDAISAIKETSTSRRDYAKGVRGGEGLNQAAAYQAGDVSRSSLAGSQENRGGQVEQGAPGEPQPVGERTVRGIQGEGSQEGQKRVIGPKRYGKPLTGPWLPSGAAGNIAVNQGAVAAQPGGAAGNKAPGIMKRLANSGRAKVSATDAETGVTWRISPRIGNAVVRAAQKSGSAVNVSGRSYSVSFDDGVLTVQKPTRGGRWTARFDYHEGAKIERTKGARRRLTVPQTDAELLRRVARALGTTEDRLAVKDGKVTGTTPGGSKFTVQIADAIRANRRGLEKHQIDVEQFEQIAGVPGRGVIITGSHATINGEHVLTILRETKNFDRTLAHEAAHFAWEELLSDEERRALTEKHGGEEGFAAYMEQFSPGDGRGRGLLRRVANRVWMWFRRVADALGFRSRNAARAAEMDVATGRVFSREPNRQPGMAGRAEEETEAGQDETAGDEDAGGEDGADLRMEGWTAPHVRRTQEFYDYKTLVNKKKTPIIHKTYAIISPERNIPKEYLRPNGEPDVKKLERDGKLGLIAEERGNSGRRALLLSELENRGIEYIPAKGVYTGSAENSYILVDVDPHLAVQLGRLMGQESVFFNDGNDKSRTGIWYSNGENAGKIHRTTGKVRISPNIEDNYTEIVVEGKPVRFSWDIDWDNLHEQGEPETEPTLPVLHYNKGEVGGIKKLETSRHGTGIGGGATDIPVVHAIMESAAMRLPERHELGRFKMRPHWYRYNAELRRMYDLRNDTLGIASKPNEEKIAALQKAGYIGYFDSANASGYTIFIQDLPVEWTIPPGIAEWIYPHEIEALTSLGKRQLLDWLERVPSFKEMEAMVMAGAQAIGGYRRMGEAFRAAFGEDADRFALLLAALSPRTTVSINYTMTARLWNAWIEAGRPMDKTSVEKLLDANPLTTASFESRRGNALKALTMEIPTHLELSSGVGVGVGKVPYFAASFYYDNTPVLDTWIGHVLGSGKDIMRKPSAWVAGLVAVRRTAAKLGMSPAEVQEAVWSFIKPVLEITARTERGGGRIKEGIGTGSVEKALEQYDPEMAALAWDADAVLGDTNVREELRKLGVLDRIYESLGRTAETKGGKQASVDRGVLRGVTERAYSNFNESRRVAAERKERKRSAASEQEASEADQGDGDVSLQIEGLAGAPELAGVNDTEEIRGARAAWATMGTESPYFKRWFGNSVVVDENGRPLVVYHGTVTNTDFTEFWTEEHDPLGPEIGAHFGTVEAANTRVEQLIQSRGDANRRAGLDPATGAKVFPVYLSIQRPAVLGDLGYWGDPFIWRTWIDERLREKQKTTNLSHDELIALRRVADLYQDEFDSGKYVSSEGKVMYRFLQVVRSTLEKFGYDGIVYENGFEDAGTKSYITFKKSQIKSATGNVGTFSPDNDDIRLQISDNSIARESINTGAKILDLAWRNIAEGGVAPEHIIRSIGPDGEEFHQRVEKAKANGERYAAELLDPMWLAYRKMTPVEKRYIKTKFIWDFEDGKLMDSPAVNEFAEAWRNANAWIAQTARELGVISRGVTSPTTGKRIERGFREVPPDRYVPHHLTDEARAALVARRGKLFNAIREKAQTNGIELGTLIGLVNSDFMTKRQGSLENSRVTNLPRTVTIDGKTIKVLDDSHSILAQHIITATRRLAIIEQFGQEGTSQYLSSVRDGLVQAGLPEHKAEFIIPRVWKRLQGARIDGDFFAAHPFARAGWHAINSAAASAQLSLATLTNAFGGHLPEMVRVGVLPTFREMAHALTHWVHADSERDLRYLGYIAEDLQAAITNGTILSGYQVTEFGSEASLDPIPGVFVGGTDVAKAARAIERVSSAMVRRATKITGFRAVNRMINHGVAYGMIRSNLRMMLDAIRNNDKSAFSKFWGKSADAAYRYLKSELGFSDADIARMAASGMPTEEDMARAVQRQIEMVNALHESPMTRPPFMAGPLMLTFLAYSTWVRKMARTTRYAVTEAKNGNFRPFLTLLVAQHVTGAMIRWMRDFVKDRENEDDYLFSWNALWMNMFEAGTLGLLGNLQYAIRHYGEPSPMNPQLKFVYDVFTPPQIEFLAEITTGLVKAFSNVSIAPLWETAKRAVPAIGAISRQVNRNNPDTLIRDLSWMAYRSSGIGKDGKWHRMFEPKPGRKANVEERLRRLRGLGYSDAKIRLRMLEMERNGEL